MTSKIMFPLKNWKPCMNSRYQMWLDYINYRKGIYVNRNGCPVVKHSPELKYLLKKGHIKLIREGKVWKHSTQRNTVAVPVKPYTVEKWTCPECGETPLWLRMDSGHARDCILREYMIPKWDRAKTLSTGHR